MREVVFTTYRYVMRRLCRLHGLKWLVVKLHLALHGGLILDLLPLLLPLHLVLMRMAEVTMKALERHL